MRRARAVASRQKLAIDVIVNSPLWAAEPNAEKIVRRAVTAGAKEASSPTGELAILLTDNSEIRLLNRTWRRLDKPTNVLSFPASDAGQSSGKRQLGDIVIAYETTAREATSEHKPLADHLSHLALHGFLHLVGYDHETERDANKMERLETAILARIGVPDPYSARGAD